MSTIDNYGEFEMPEEKATIEVVEDPVNVVLASYEMFKELMKGIKKYLITSYEPEEYVAPVYSCALKVFEGKQELYANTEQIEKILEDLRKNAKEYDGTGVFLSSLINSTKINNLFINEFPKIDRIGCYLKKGKVIILGEKNNSISLGEVSEKGSITINRGIINLQGYLAKGGNHINIGKIRGDQGGCMEDGGGNFINQGTIDNPQPYSIGNYINLNKKVNRKLTGIDLAQKQNNLKTQLEQKLAELNFLKTEAPSKLIQVNAYDWQKFDKELNEICGKIQEVYGKR